MERRIVRVTHPFHPLHGCEFELVEIKPTMGMEFVHYTGDDGVVRSIRRPWTSVACEDPFVRAGSGRSAFRVSDLLALSSLLAVLDGDGRTGREPDGGAETVREIMPSLNYVVFVRTFLSTDVNLRDRSDREG